MGVLPGPDLDPGYLFRVLEQVDLTDLSDGSVVQQIKKPAIESLPIGVPHREIQNQIAAQIDEVEVVLDRLQVSLQGATRRSAVLRRAVLAAAFSGQLVPQDLDDEPASVLLERIGAERAAAAPTKRTRKAKAS
jgi:type I restriction enzyme S subunit